jgi:hypothetical protein
LAARPPLTAKGDGLLTVRRCGPAGGTAKLEGAGEALWNQPEYVAAHNFARSSRPSSANQRIRDQVTPPCAGLELGRLEQFASIRGSKTRTSGEVLDDFGTFFRAHDAMKG